MTITATDLPSPTIPVTASAPPGTPGTCPGRGGGGSAPGGGAWPGTGAVTSGINGSGRPVGPCGTTDVFGGVGGAGAPGAGAGVAAGAGAWPGAAGLGVAAGGGDGSPVAAGGAPRPPNRRPATR